MWSCFQDVQCTLPAKTRLAPVKMPSSRPKWAAYRNAHDSWALFNDVLASRGSNIGKAVATPCHDWVVTSTAESGRWRSIRIMRTCSRRGKRDERPWKPAGLRRKKRAWCLKQRTNVVVYSCIDEKTRVACLYQGAMENAVA
jgi:hypothetical protein